MTGVLSDKTSHVLDDNRTSGNKEWSRELCHSTWLGPAFVVHNSDPEKFVVQSRDVEWAKGNKGNKGSTDGTSITLTSMRGRRKCS